MAEIDLTDLMHLFRAAKAPSQLWHAALDYYHQRNVCQVSYHLYQGLSGPNVGGGVTVMTDGFSDDWVCAYIQKQLFHVDPIPDFARSSGTAFYWSDIPGLIRLSPAQIDYLKQMRAAGIGEGLAFHVHGPAMRNAYVGLGFGAVRPDLAPTQITEFQCAAQLAHFRYCEMTAGYEARKLERSPREREILGWIARGKSNSAIGQILGISHHTVDTLVRRLFDKLGVSDRTSAALRGIGSGLILPPPMV